MGRAVQAHSVAAQENAYAGRSRVRLRIPQQSLVERPRLIDLLLRHNHARLVLLQAPAGYGKTSLLQQWASECLASGDTVARTHVTWPFPKRHSAD